jgi:hypothetical protein
MVMEAVVVEVAVVVITMIIIATAAAAAAVVSRTSIDQPGERVLRIDACDIRHHANVELCSHPRQNVLSAADGRRAERRQ